MILSYKEQKIGVTLFFRHLLSSRAQTRDVMDRPDGQSPSARKDTSFFDEQTVNQHGKVVLVVYAPFSRHEGCPCTVCVRP